MSESSLSSDSSSSSVEVSSLSRDCKISYSDATDDSDVEGEPASDAAVDSEPEDAPKRKAPAKVGRAGVQSKKQKAEAFFEDLEAVRLK